MSNQDKFIWNPDDIRIVSEEDFKKEATVVYESKSDFCKNNSHCYSCDMTQKRIAEQISQGIFDSFFVSEEISETIFRRVMKNLSGLCKQATQGKIVLTKELYYCVKVQLVDAVTKKTDLQITEEMIRELF